MKLILVGAVFLLAIVALGLLGYAAILAGDGERVTPQGEGTVVTASGEFEAFPLPDYVSSVLPGGTRSYLVEAEPGIKLHVLEIGEGFPVYLQHGNPTNALLYRRVVAELPLDRYRLIMPTLPGLGFSSKIPASQHTLDNHMRWMSAVIEKLALDEMIYVGQDWGGPVGMGAMARNPGLMKGAVVMNTSFSAPTEERELSRAHALANRPLLGELAFQGIGSIWNNLAQIQGDPSSMPPDVIELYARPVEESGNAKAPLALMRMVATGPNHPSAEQMREIEAYVEGLDIPAALVWGMQDPILAQGLGPMKRLFPGASVNETEAGHFLQEEVPAAIAAAIEQVHGAVMAAAAPGPEE